MSEIEATTCERLLDKSQEAFLLAIEPYNRPTIRYHAEKEGYRPKRVDG